MSSDFLVFAGQPGANVVTQSTYASLAALPQGFQTGIAESNQLNKVWRQSSIMSAVLAQFMVDNTGQNAIDDGTIATLLGNLQTAVQAATFAIDVGVANSYSISYSAGPANPLVDGATYTFRPAHTNTTGSSLSVNGSPAHTIVDEQHAGLIGGEIAASGFVTVKWAANLNQFVIQTTTGGGFQHGPTASPGTNNTYLATCAFVAAATAGTGAGIIAASIGTNGYAQFSNGLIVQWGRVTNSSGSTVVNYPITFPTAVFTTTLAPSATGEIAFSFIGSQTTVHFTAFARDSSSNPTAAVQDWVAFGH